MIDWQKIQREYFLAYADFYNFWDKKVPKIYDEMGQRVELDYIEDVFLIGVIEDYFESKGFVCYISRRPHIWNGTHDVPVKINDMFTRKNFQAEVFYKAFELVNLQINEDGEYIHQSIH